MFKFDTRFSTVWNLARRFLACLSFFSFLFFVLVFQLLEPRPLDLIRDTLIFMPVCVTGFPALGLRSSRCALDPGSSV